MPARKIVLIACVYDQGDILQDFIDWHLDLGVDLILIQDFGSRDGSPELLDRLARTRPVAWFRLPERDMTKYKPGDALAKLARDEYQADWIILCDADEFICPIEGTLRSILEDAERSDLSVVNIPRYNMTGAPIAPGQSAIRQLTLRVDEPLRLTIEQQTSGDIPVPYMFVYDGWPHTIVRASAFAAYGDGAHLVQTSWGAAGDTGKLRILHFCIRDYERFETKVANTAKWLEDNRHLFPTWGWHWRRWIRLRDAGMLREEYEQQFVASDAHAQTLVREGTCSVDATIANWSRRRRRPGWLGVLRRIVRATAARAAAPRLP